MIYNVERLDGENRIWGQCFQNENPQMLEEAFQQYFQVGKFPPRPADIQAIITEKRQCVEYQNYIPPSQEEKEAFAVWHSSDEFREFLENWTAKIEASALKRTTNQLPTTIDRPPLDIEIWDPQQLQQTKQARLADLEVWKDRRVK